MVRPAHQVQEQANTCGCSTVHVSCAERSTTTELLTVVTCAVAVREEMHRLFLVVSLLWQFLHSANGEARTRPREGVCEGA